MLDDTRLYLGLMSGTSMDGVDAVLVRFVGHAIEVQKHCHLDMPQPLQRQLASIVAEQAVSLPDLLVADQCLADLYIDATRIILDKVKAEIDEIAAIGSHGQTICHRPDLFATLQIGDPSRIAEGTGIPVVADFRRRDLAASGQGAPLAPAFHAAALRTTSENRVILNLGGIANVSWLPADPSIEVVGFDTGPANTLLDHWTSQHLGKTYDEDGQWARQGRVDQGLLTSMLEDPYFSLKPPKSTGREHFNPDWLTQTLAGHPEVENRDVQATLTELTAISIAKNILSHCGKFGALYACGGGANNSFLMERIAANLDGFHVATTEVLGIPVQMMEAIAFAWLARQTMNGQPGNLPSVTGADHPVVLGGIFPA